MSFMEKQITGNVRWLRVETTHGTEFVSVFDSGLDWPNSGTLRGEALQDAITQLQDYTDGEPESWENIKGFGARLSAPGYLDCTEWTVFDTETEAREYLDSEYPDEDESPETEF